MFILVTYDVETVTKAGQRRLRSVAKACMNYGQRVQNSVFECILDEANFAILKYKIESVIDTKSDSVKFYIMGNNWDKKVISIGKQTSYNMNDAFVI